MTVLELESILAVQDFSRTQSPCIICFSATWCGPCQAAKPAFETMSKDYAKEPKQVKFAVVYEHNLGDNIHNYNVRAFPTYVMMVEAKEVARVEGVNLDGIKQMIESNYPTFVTSNEAESLGGSSPVFSPADVRAQRIAKLSTEQLAEENPKEERSQEAEVNIDNQADNSSTGGLGKAALETLTGAMGFSSLRAQKGLKNGGGTVEGAVDWLMQHQDDADIDDPVESKLEKQVAKSYKCNQTGKIFSSMADLELYAVKTGYTDFEECTEAAKKLSPEEKARKLEEISGLLKARRAEREEQEKAEEVEREKQRRFAGKEMSKTREQLDIEQRKREALKRKKEKEQYKREREYLRAELAKDKAERQANKGKLGSKLGVDGYSPAVVQYDVDQGASGEKKTKSTGPSASKIDGYITKVSSYRAGGDGGKCLKVLLAYVSNIVDKPEETKFRTINTENKVFKAKVKPFVGAKQLLVAVGFQQAEDSQTLVLREEADMELLSLTKAKLSAALSAY